MSTSGPDNSTTILTFLEELAHQRGDEIALAPFRSPVISANTLARRVTVLAASLQARGVRAAAGADRVAIVLPNGPQLSLALLASCVAGVAVPLNPAYQADEFAGYFRHTRCRFLLCGRNESGPCIEAAQASDVEVLRLGVELASLDDDAAQPEHILQRPRPEDLAVVMLTSGSTGRGKVVPLTHRNLCCSALDVARSVDLSHQDRCLSMWEQFHIGGIVDLLLAPLASGGQVISAGGFDAANFFAALDETRPTWFQGVPTTLRELCVYARRHNLDPRGSSLRFLRSVAAALPPTLMSEIEERFGVPVIQTFGMTEASPLITSTRLPPARRKPGSTGSSCGPSVAILADDGRPLPAGKPGVVAVRGDNIFAGYENDAEANAEAFLDGWFRTGDVGYLDADGDLFLVGRVKEMINRGGEKISPQEVDDVLLRHPAVSQAATFSRPHPTLGEDIAVAVVLRPGQTVSDQEVRDFARHSLAEFKVPRHVFFLDDLPRCPVGKVRRRELTDRFRETVAPAVRIAPTNPLQGTLAALWARELDVQEVGIDDDFASLGGDSLSSVRILVAARALFGVEIPDRVLKRFRTVRSMAEALNELGVPVTFAAERAATGPGADPKQVTIERALAQADQLLADDTGAISSFSGYATLAQFQQWMQTRIGQATPADLQPLLQRGVPLGRGPRFVWEAIRTYFEECRKTNLSAALSVTWERLRLRREFSHDCARASEPLRWQRRRLGSHANLYAADDERTRQRTLIVGFAGNFQRLMLPAYSLLCALDPTRCELLVVGSGGRNHYRDGIPGFGDTIETAASALGDFAKGQGYARVVALGTSAGGGPAIVAALVNHWERVLAVGLDAITDHPHLATLLRRLIDEPTSHESGPTVLAAYSAKNARDQRGATQLREYFPAATLLPDVRFGGHNLLQALHRRNELRPFLERHLLGKD